MVSYDADVVIVGGGLAGTRSALLLARQRYKVVLLEAKERLGGRTESSSQLVRSQQHTFDFGAQWIAPDVLQPIINNLISEYDLKIQLQHNKGKGLLLFEGRLQEYEGEVSTAKGFDKYEQMIQDQDRWADNLKQNSQLNTKYVTPDNWLNTICSNPMDSGTKGMFETSIRCLTTSEPGEIDWLFWLYFLNSGRGYAVHSDTYSCAQHATINGGTQQLSELMAKEVTRISKQNKIYLKSPVYSITQLKTGVMVEYKQGTTSKKIKKIHARRVIVAVPPPMANKIIYDPPLPAQRDLVCQRMRMGSVIKCFIVYENAFWRERGLSGEIFTDTAPVCNYYDASSADGKVFALIGLIAGRDAIALSSHTKEYRKQLVVEQLVKLLGEQASKHINYFEKNWLEDPWSRGGYMAVMSPNTLHLASKVLKEPVGYIHWAGTETSDEWYGYMEGALQSADRVSSEIVPLLTKSKL